MYFYDREQRALENPGTIFTAKSKGQQHMMCLQTLSSAGEKQQNLLLDGKSRAFLTGMMMPYLKRAVYLGYLALPIVLPLMT